MSSSVYWFCVAGIVVSAVLTECVRRMALARGVLDLPNERSSHAIPTPRGGGLAIVATASILIGIFAHGGYIGTALAWALLGGGIPVAWIGYLDDRRSASVLARFCVHLAAAVWAIFILGGMPHLEIGSKVIDLGIAGDAMAVLAIVWTLNLFNFMDGIDGIAAVEAIFVALGGAALFVWSGLSSDTAVAGLAIAAACAGFLIWNWPPARIFMGDSGSGYLGFALGTLIFGSGRENSESLFMWLILGGVFFVDATVTLLRRMTRRERLQEAHRNHAYQRLARRWQSHRRVTLAVLYINVLWLLPLAWLALRAPLRAYLVAGLALAPLVILALVVGAGRQEVVAGE